jgi:hypothetical protein
MQEDKSPVSDITKPTVQRAFKVSACIDWIELTITTRSPTQFQHLQSKLRRVLNLPESAKEIFVDPINAGAGGVSNRFEITLHDAHANSYQELNRIMVELSDKFPFASPPEITGIEVAIDFYSRSNSTAELREMTRRLQTHLAAHGNARQFDPTVKKVRFLANDNRTDPAQMLYVGNKGEPITHQIYFKQTDHNQKPITPSEWRARAEFTLRGTALADFGLNYLSDLRAFRFERMAGRLHFRILKPLAALTAGKCREFTCAVERMWSQINDNVAGLPLGWLKYGRYPNGKPRYGGRGKEVAYNRHTVADAELNALVRKKLAQLSKTFST